MVLYEKHAKNQGWILEWRLRTEILVIVAAFLSFSGSIAAISFGGIVSHLKDIDLATYQTEADGKIAAAQKEAGDANKAAGVANQSAAQANLEDTQLRIQLANHETNEGKIEADLAKQNKATSDFAHALAQQQGIMSEQAKVSPQLAPAQMELLSQMLKPFAGQDVEMHTTSDTVVERLASSIATSLNQAGITTKSFTTDMGALYQGVSIAINDPGNVPPLANTLVMDLRQFGIDVHPVASPQRVPVGHVAIFLGPD
jgi:hypothetical protein